MKIKEISEKDIQWKVKTKVENMEKVAQKCELIAQSTNILVQGEPLLYYCQRGAYDILMSSGIH